MSRKHYPRELREQVVSEVRSGRSVAEVAREYEPCAQTIHRWVALDEGRSLEVESEDMVALRKRNRQLETEISILKKAAAWFARETLDGR